MIRRISISRLHKQRRFASPTFGDGQYSTRSAPSLLLHKFAGFISKNMIRLQGPTADEVVQDLDLSTKTCLITGANSGIGLEMTRCLISRNCTVLMACRNLYAANQAAKQLKGNGDRIKIYEINLASFKSVQKCINDILNKEKKIDIFLVNAGVFGLPWTLTEDMFETIFQVNYLSQFHLILGLEKILAPDARIVFTSTESHRNINMKMNDRLILTKNIVSLPENEYTSIKAYNISKLCGILAMHYLSYRWLKTKKTVYCAHPGSFVYTGLARNWWPYEILYILMTPFSKSISQGASTPLYCATSPDMAGVTDVYYKDLKRCDESHLAQDRHLAFSLYDLSCELIQERVDIQKPEKVVEPEEPKITEKVQNTVDENLEPSYDN